MYIDLLDRTCDVSRYANNFYVVVERFERRYLVNLRAKDESIFLATEQNFRKYDLVPEKSMTPESLKLLTTHTYLQFFIQH